MLHNKPVTIHEKAMLHPRNRHRDRYDFEVLTERCTALAPFVRLSPRQEASIDFSDPEAVKWLNKALLQQYYDIDFWDIPDGYLCPPIPGRADYIHYMADLVSSTPARPDTIVRCLDIGTGANCIYPIIGAHEYGWHFVGSDIDPVAVRSATAILESNPWLAAKVSCRLQPNRKDTFRGIIREGEYFDVSVCNPPFHASLAAAEAATLRKLSNLSHKKVTRPVLNFGGQHGELWCEGGEQGFVWDMIHQSRLFAASCGWFSVLISKQANLKTVYHALEKVAAAEVKTIPMGQGNKISRVVAWRFMG